MITEDRRAFPRIQKKIGIKFTQHQKDQRKNFAVTGNISFGGVYFPSLVKYEIGDLVDCWISGKKKNDEFYFLTRVVRCEITENYLIKTYGVAVEFQNIQTPSEKYLIELLKEKPQKK